MSSGPTILDTRRMTMSRGDGYSDEDLLASLSGFAVEGQTEKDLATIKAMFSAHSHQIFPSVPASRQQQGPAQYPAWPAQHHHHQQQAFYLPSPYQQQQQQPPPNTPTFSKSLELHGFDPAFAPSQNSPYFGRHPAGSENGYNGYNGGSFGRRDVSLDREYVRSLQQHQGGGSAPGLDENNDDDRQSAGMDMDGAGAHQNLPETQVGHNQMEGTSYSSNTQFNGQSMAQPGFPRGDQIHKDTDQHWPYSQSTTPRPNTHTPAFIPFTANSPSPPSTLDDGAVGPGHFSSNLAGGNHHRNSTPASPPSANTRAARARQQQAYRQ